MPGCMVLARGSDKASLCEFHRDAQLTGRHRILKRRVAWVIGQWVGSEEECAKLEIVWQILIHLLAERGESSDMAVNLTAAISVKECVDVSRSPGESDVSFGSLKSPTLCLSSRNLLRS